MPAPYRLTVRKFGLQSETKVVGKVVQLNSSPF